MLWSILHDVHCFFWFLLQKKKKHNFSSKCRSVPLRSVGDVTQLGSGINKRLYREEDKEEENRKLERAREGRSEEMLHDERKRKRQSQMIKAVERKIKGKNFFFLKLDTYFYLDVFRIFLLAEKQNCHGLIIHSAHYPV